MRIRYALFAIPFALATATPFTTFAAVSPPVSNSRWHGADALYVRMAHERLDPRWNTFVRELSRMPVGDRYQDPALATEVVIVVETDGTISRVERGFVSGLAGFDDAAIDLLKDVGRLPVPPPSLTSDDGKVYLNWRFTRSIPTAEVGSVTERRIAVEAAIPQLIMADRADEAVVRVDEARIADPEREHELVGRLVA